MRLPREEVASDYQKHLFAMKKITVKGLQMAFKEEGEGAPIVLLHGNPTSSYLWRNVVPHLKGLGRCLVHDPQVMVLDEPAAGLDPRARVELRELIRLLATRMKKTVLISSHILTELGEICDSVAIIEAGRILAHGTIQEIEKQQRMISGNTAARTLLARIASADDLDAQTDRLEKWLLEQPHVTHVECIHGQATFHLEDNNEGQQALLKRLIDEGFPMIEFHGKSQTLEDTFMNITQGITQ